MHSRKMCWAKWNLRGWKQEETQGANLKKSMRRATMMTTMNYVDGEKRKEPEKQQQHCLYDRIRMRESIQYDFFLRSS